MNWERKGKYLLVSGAWQICRNDPGTEYWMYHCNERYPRTGVYTSAEDAKAVAEEMERRRAA